MDSNNSVSLMGHLGNIQQRNGVISHLPQTILCKLLQNNPTINESNLISETTSIHSTDSTNLISDILSNVPVTLKDEPKSPVKSNSIDIICTISSNNDGPVKNIKSQSQESLSLVLIPTNTQKEFFAKYTALSPSEAVKLNPKKRLLQRHLLEKVKEFDRENQDQMNDKLLKSAQDAEAPFGRGKNGKPLTRSPFIPSYMDPNSGPFFCKVCGYKASGLHYKVMACEGCKGFFRRSVQKKLKYVCKMNNNCPINSDNRTKCQECRWQLCIKAGMDVESVLDDKERRAKNELIKVNRLKRKQADFNSSFSQQSSFNDKSSSQESLEITNRDSFESQNKTLLTLIESMTEAFEKAFNTNEDPKQFPGNVQNQLVLHVQSQTHEFTNRVATFAKMIPGVSELSLSVQNTLLRNRCLDIICLCTALSYNAETRQLRLPSKRLIDSNFIAKHKHLEPLWQFAKRTAEHRLTKSEMAILAGLALLANNTPEPLESVYTQLLAALDLLMNGQPIRNSKLLIAIFSDLQGLTNRMFELRAPLGHQLLFDTDIDNGSIETSPPTSTYHNINLGHMIAINPSSEERKKNPVPGTLSSIFAFSYGDKK